MDQPAKPENKAKPVHSSLTLGFLVMGLMLLTAFFLFSEALKYPAGTALRPMAHTMMAMLLTVVGAVGGSAAAWSDFKANPPGPQRTMIISLALILNSLPFPFYVCQLWLLHLLGYTLAP